MNNRAEQFHQDNREMVISLRLKLERILDELKSGNIISLDDRKEVFVLLDCYIEQLKIPEKIAMANLKRTQQKIMSKFNASLVMKELENSQTAVELLVKVGREKMVKTDGYVASEAGKVLIENGYLEEIVSRNNREKYYVLSSKGVQSLKNKIVANKLKETVPGYSVPDNTVVEFDEWSNLYGKRVQLLHEYFEIVRKNAEYLIFPVGEGNDLVMGCEISDNMEINYVFPAVEEWIEISKDLDIINRMAESGLIDNILIVASNEKEKEKVVQNKLVAGVSVISLK